MSVDIVLDFKTCKNFLIKTKKYDKGQLSELLLAFFNFLFFSKQFREHLKNKKVVTVRTNFFPKKKKL